MSVRIHAVAFDWGGVLIEDPGPGLIAYCAHALGVSNGAYLAAHRKFAVRLQNGTISDKNFWKNIAQQLKVPIPPTTLWKKAFAACYHEHEKMFAFAHACQRAKIRTAILSNTEKSAVEFFHSQHYHCFDAALFSCALGVSKPNASIYEACLSALDVPASQTLFIDDKRHFVEGAIGAGLHGIHFRTLTQVFDDIRALDATLPIGVYT